MARRAALARAFSVEPEILLLDEPFVSLDEATANRLRQLLIDLWRSSPVTVLMVTHNVREAVRLADRLIILSPRPAHVVGVVDLPLPRERAPWHEARCPLQELAERFPSLDAGVGGPDSLEGPNGRRAGDVRDRATRPARPERRAAVGGQQGPRVRRRRGAFLRA